MYNSLTLILYFQVLYDMMKFADVELGQVLWILNNNQVISGEGLVCEELPPIIDFNIQLLYGLKDR